MQADLQAIYMSSVYQHLQLADLKSAILALEGLEEHKMLDKPVSDFLDSLRQVKR